MSTRATSTFGSHLREARQRAKDPRNGRVPLRQQTLADLIAERLGTVGSPTPQAIGRWERDEYRPDARERTLLLALVGALLATGGLADARAADALLAAGGYAALNSGERERLGLPPTHVSVDPSRTLEHSPSLNPDALAATLLQHLHSPLTDALRAELPTLAALLAGALNGQLLATEAQQRLEASPALAELGRALAGVELPVGHTLVHFGSDNQFGTITVRDLVTGNPYHVTVQRSPTAPPAPDPLVEALSRFKQLPTDDQSAIPAPDSFSTSARPIPHRMVLRPTELFTGRDADLRSLAMRIQSPSDDGVVVITGMGGVGKTQLAVEFAHRYGRYFAGGVFWIDCTSAEHLPNEIAAAGGPGGLDLPDFGALSAEEQVRRVKQAWASPIPRLLIFDTCEDERLLQDYRPRTGGCRVIVTSRRQQWSPGQHLTQYELGLLNRTASVNLLRRLSETLSGEQADRIAEELGDLPLALYLAGSYLTTSPATTPEAFLADIKRQRLKQSALTNEEARAVPTPTLEEQQQTSSLYAILTIDLEQLNPAEQRGILARTLLARVACLQPPGITFPRDFLSRTAPVALDDPDQVRLVETTINRLINLGLLNHEADGEADGRLRMHRLVAAAVQQAQPLDVDVDADVDADVDIDADDPLTTFAPAALVYCADLIEQATARFPDRATEGRTLLDREQVLWGQFLDWGYAHETSVEAVSLSARATARLGTYWSLIGANAKPEPLARLERARTTAQRIGDRLGEATVLWAIGDIQQFRRDSRAALRSYQLALRLFREIDHRRGEATMLRAIGDIQQFRRDPDAALRSYELALRLFHEIGDRLGEANVLAARSRLLIDSDSAQSQAMLQQALTIRESLHDAHDIGADLGNYGITLLQHGRGAEALPYLERARAIFAEQGNTELLPKTDALIAQARGSDDNKLATSPRPDIDQMTEHLLSLLGDLELAAHSDGAALQIVEALLSQREEDSWHLNQAVRQLWEDKRDPTTPLTAHAARARHALELANGSLARITATIARELAEARRLAEHCTEEAIASGDPVLRTITARQVEQAAAQAEQQPGAPWQSLAATLRALVTRLEDA